jgi:hypothetical protein
MVRLDLDGTPPSLNALMYRNWRVHQRVKKQWQGLFGMALLASPLPKVHTPEIPRAIYAKAEMWFPARRKRDEGNYRSIVEKCLGDALVDGNYLDDDTPDKFRFGGLEIHGELVKPLGRTVVDLFVSDG